MSPDKVLNDAIAFVAEQWKQSEAAGSLPTNINLRDRVTLFASPLRKRLFANFPELRAADNQVMLLVVAEGIAQAGSVARDKLEQALGIILPPDFKSPLSAHSGLWAQEYAVLQPPFCVPPKPRLIRIVMLSLSHMASASVHALRV